MRGEPNKRTSLDLKQFIDKVPACRGASRLLHVFCFEPYFGSMLHGSRCGIAPGGLVVSLEYCLLSCLGVSFFRLWV